MDSCALRDGCENALLSPSSGTEKALAEEGREGMRVLGKDGTRVQRSPNLIHRYTGFRLNGLWIYGHFGFISVIMVNGQSDFSTKLFGLMVISAIWSTLSGQNHGLYIRNPVYSS